MWRQIETLLSIGTRHSFIEAYRLINTTANSAHGDVTALEEARIRLVFARAANRLTANMDQLAHQQISSALKLLHQQHDQSSEDWSRVYFTALDLQATIYASSQPPSWSAARSTLRTALNESQRRSNWLWIYWFQLRLTQMEPRGALNRLNETAAKAGQRGDYQVLRLLKLHQATILLATGRYDELRDLLTQSQWQQQTDQCDLLLNCWHCILLIAMRNYYGDSSGASWNLNRLQGDLLTRLPADSAASNQPLYISVAVQTAALPNTSTNIDSNTNTSTNNNGNMISLAWISGVELRLLVDLLAAQTKMGELSLTPAKRQLQQALERLAKPPPTILLQAIKCELLHQSVNLLLLRSRLDDAQAVLQRWRECVTLAVQPFSDNDGCTVNDGCAVNNGNQFDDWLAWQVIMQQLSEAEYHQSAGRFRQAIDSFSQLLATSNSITGEKNNANNASSTDLTVYICLQISLIYLGSEWIELTQQDDSSKHLLNTLDQLRSHIVLVNNTQNPSGTNMVLANDRVACQVAMRLVEGLLALRNRQYHQTKLHLLESLRLCSTTVAQSQQSAALDPQLAPSPQFKSTQLKIFTLIILGRLYEATNNLQSTKMFEAANGLAHKMRSDILIRVTEREMARNKCL